jgi:LuxR family maltose regulon positive regulatory protein
LLAEWRAAAGREAAVAWLSLDASDDDPARFLDGLIAAMETARRGLGESAALLLRSGQPVAPEAILSALINDLSAASNDLPRGLALVLDDYHVISNPAVHDILAFLLAHLPLLLHLVILSREDPPLPLAKLRVRGQLTEIREGDLRFTATETATFLAQTMGVRLAEADIADLVAHTEGWAAALQIAGLSLQNRSDPKTFIAAFRGDDRYVMDYLMDEVFSRQPPGIQEFLLQTAILETLCGSLCDAVLGRGEREQGNLLSRSPAPLPPCTPAQAILEYLERANLFVVSLDNRREWYRYHHLFADLLRYRLQRVCPERLPELHRRACRWYADAGDPDEAMRHALAIPDPTLAADLAERYLLQMIGSSRIVTYLGWIQRLPAEIVRGRAYLAAGCGWATVLVNQPEATLNYVNIGEAALAHYAPVSSAPEGRPITEAEVAGNLMAIRSYAARARNDLAGAVEHAQQALATLPAEADAIRCAVALNLGLLYLDSGELEPARQALYEAFEAARRSRTNTYVAVSALSQMGGIAAMRGKLREAESLFQRAVRYGADEAGPPVLTPASGVIHGWLMWLEYQRNEIAAAQAHLDRVLQAVGQLGVPEATTRAFLYQARLAQCRGELDSAEAWLARVEELARTQPIQGLVQAEWVAFRAQHALLRDDPASAAALLEAHGLKADDLMQRPASWLRPRLAGYVLLARILAGQGASQRADAVLEQVCLIAEAIPDVEVLLQALARRAAIAQSLHGNSGRALPYLARALNLAAAEGFARPILDAGGALVKPLRQAIMEGIQPAFARKLLADLAEEERRRATTAHVPGASEAPDTSRSVEPLTDRERQVLRLLAAGLSSNEVADELVISVSTARSYIKSLYGKLDAHSREEAIERGLKYGLL